MNDILLSLRTIKCINLFFILKRLLSLLNTSLCLRLFYSIEIYDKQS